MRYEHRSAETDDRYRTWSRYVFFGFVAVAAYLLLEEHRAHLIAFVPYILLAACPLMHLLHHRGHRHDGGESQSKSEAPSAGTHEH
jgi:DUF2933 family protein